MMNEEFVFGALAGQVGVLIFAAILRQFLPAYIGEKGKNLATKEDIGDITEIVESVKTDNAKIIEQVRGRNALRTLAVEKRLDAHQQAYVLWSGMSSILFADEEQRTKYLQKCSDFWINNCVFLSPDASRAFAAAIGATRIHKDYVDEHRGSGDKKHSQVVKENHRQITAAGNIILGAVELPPLTDDAAENLGVAVVDGGTY